jgi:hypothetical protein
VKGGILKNGRRVGRSRRDDAAEVQLNRVASEPVIADGLTVILGEIVLIGWRTS